MAHAPPFQRFVAFALGLSERPRNLDEGHRDNIDDYHRRDAMRIVVDEGQQFARQLQFLVLSHVLEQESGGRSFVPIENESIEPPSHRTRRTDFESSKTIHDRKRHANSFDTYFDATIYAESQSTS